MPHNLVLLIITLLFAHTAVQAIETGFAVTSKRVPILRENGVRVREPSSHVVKYSIAGGKVTDTTLLYSSTSAKHLRPRINFEGTHVAFYHYEGNTCHLAVMKADGSDIRLLAPATSHITWYDGRNAVIDWPYGDYIYYRHDAKNIYRVNVKTAKTERITEYSDSFRKWSINLPGTRVAVQNSMCNMLHPFPLSSYTISENCDPSGCNVALSSSGTYVNWFTGTAHNLIHVGSWDGSQSVQQQATIYNDSMSQWAKKDIGRGMDWPEWSVNSDKWMCLQVQLAGRFSSGSNQVLLNWVDNVVIPTSINTSETVHYGTGDLWIQPPPGKDRHWEAVNGEWMEIGEIAVIEPLPDTCGGDGCNTDTSISPDDLPWIRILSPLPGLGITEGSTLTIKWETNQVDNAIVFYSSDEGDSWNLLTVEGSIRKGIDSLWSNYTWAPPATASSTISIAVADYNDATIRDETGPLQFSNSASFRSMAIRAGSGFSARVVAPGSLKITTHTVVQGTLSVFNPQGRRILSEPFRGNTMTVALPGPAFKMAIVELRSNCGKQLTGRLVVMK